jgi:fumarylpyruvate hydrolase
MPAFSSLRARFNLSGFEGVEPIVHGIELRLFEEPMAYAIPLWTPPALPVAGSAELFPVRRIFCVGRNYAEHQKEMGGDGREQPFFFLKSEHALVARGGEVHYPAKTSNYHYETELVVALATGGRRIDAKRANEHIFGYTVGLDMTRRDLQQWGKDHGRPWDFGKNFDESAPCGELVRAAKIGHPSNGSIWLNVNGKQRQRADLADMIWSVPEQIAYLSEHYSLAAGDIIFTGTPAGVGPVKPGDELHAGIDGVAELKVRISPAL